MKKYIYISVILTMFGVGKVLPALASFSCSVEGAANQLVVRPLEVQEYYVNLHTNEGVQTLKNDGSVSLPSEYKWFNNPELIGEPITSIPSNENIDLYGSLVENNIIQDEVVEEPMVEILPSEPVINEEPVVPEENIIPEENVIPEVSVPEVEPTPVVPEVSEETTENVSPEIVEISETNEQEIIMEEIPIPEDLL